MNRLLSAPYRLLTACLLIGTMVLPLTTHATSNPLFKANVTQVAKTGPAARVSGVVQLTSRLRQPVKVRLAYLKTFEGAPTAKNQKNRKRKTIKRSKMISVRANGQGKLPFRFALENDGKHLALLMIEVYDKAGRQLLGRQSVDLYFMVSKDRYQQSSYAGLYVPRETVTPVTKAPPGAKIVPYPQTDKAKQIDPELLKDLKSRKARSSAAISPALDLQSSIAADARASLDDAQQTLPGGWGFLAQLLGIADAKAATGYFRVKGKFSFRGIDNYLHPSWYWEVELRGKKDDGEWVTLATDRIDQNGEWYASFAHYGYSGQKLQILYRMKNFYVSFEKNEEGAPYLWGHTFSDLPATLDIGHWYANTSESGTAFGVADAYANTVLYLGKSLMHSIDPIREQPIRVFIPNTWYNCGLDQEEPHSCAWSGGDDGAGQLWLAPKHMYTINWLLAEPVDGLSIPSIFVITDFIPYPKTLFHELAHQTHYEYWDNEFPPYDSTLQIYDCISPEAKGRALVEGFADAIAFWHLHELDEAAPTEVSYTGNIESPYAPCNNESEPALVAGTLWDLMDTHVDDPLGLNFDHMNFDNPADVLLIFLEGGYHETMSDLEDDYVTAFGPSAPDSDQLHPVECVFIGNHIFAGSPAIGYAAYGSAEFNTQYNHPGGCNY